MDRIDLLPLMPKVTSSGYDILVEVDGEYIELWYKHPRVKPIRIRRFADPKVLGALLGQYQAEGTKDSKKGFRLEFTNKIILEHRDFVAGLSHLGIGKERMIFEFMHRPDFTDYEEKIAEFEKSVGPISVIQESDMKGKYGFRTYIRNVLLIEVFLNILHYMRGRMADGNTDVSDSFFAKLLTGDGTMDIRTKNREYGYPTVRIKITDKNVGYLEDYAKIMKNLGFRSHVLEKHISVRASCSLKSLLYLYKIRAFENTINWNKLLVVIGLCLEGRRYSTHCRFIELFKLESFTSLDMMKIYGFCQRVINDWLNNKEKEGLLIGTRKQPYPVRWSLTDEAKELAETLSEWRAELEVLIKNKKTRDLRNIMETLKVRKHPPSQPNSAPI